MVGIFAIAHQPLLFHIPGIDKDEVAAEEHFFGLVGSFFVGLSVTLWLGITLGDGYSMT